jgi:hypothetical protein
MLCAPAFRQAVEQAGIKLMGYQNLKAAGFERMKRPWLADPYGTREPALGTSNREQP